MCLLVPGRIVKINEDTVTVDYEVEQRIAKVVEGTVSIGDYVLVQGGIIIEKVQEKEAKAALKLYAEALKNS